MIGSIIKRQMRHALRIDLPRSGRRCLVNFSVIVVTLES